MTAPQRGIFLINRRFQLRFSIYVCAWLVALSFAYPLIVDSLFTYFATILRVDPAGTVYAAIMRTQRDIFWLLVMFQIIFMVLTFLISVFMSHRIAGPIYKLGRFFSEVRDGKLDGELFFRKKDHFHELAGQYNEMMAAVRAMAKPDGQAAIQAAAHIEKAMPLVSGEAQAELQKAVALLRTSGNAGREATK